MCEKMHLQKDSIKKNLIVTQRNLSLVRNLHKKMITFVRKLLMENYE